MRKIGRQNGRGQNTIRGGSDPIVPQNCGPIPSGFGGHSRLLLLETAARVLAAQEEGNWRVCKTGCQTKPQRRNKEKAWQSLRHHPNSQSR